MGRMYCTECVDLYSIRVKVRQMTLYRANKSYFESFAR